MFKTEEHSSNLPWDFCLYFPPYFIFVQHCGNSVTKASISKRPDERLYMSNLKEPALNCPQPTTKTESLPRTLIHVDRRKIQLGLTSNSPRTRESKLIPPKSKAMPYSKRREKQWGQEILSHRKQSARSKAARSRPGGARWQQRAGDAPDWLQQPPSIYLFQFPHPCSSVRGRLLWDKHGSFSRSVASYLTRLSPRSRFLCCLSLQTSSKPYPHLDTPSLLFNFLIINAFSFKTP